MSLRAFSYSGSGSSGGGSTAPSFVKSANETIVLATTGTPYVLGSGGSGAYNRMFSTTQSGNAWKYVYYDYFSPNTGTGGTGDILLTFPTGIIADTSIVPANAAAITTPKLAYGDQSIIEGQVLISFEDTGQSFAFIGTPILYSTTQFRVVGPFYGAVSVALPVTFSNNLVNLTNATNVRISGWIRVPTT